MQLTDEVLDALEASTVLSDDAQIAVMAALDGEQSLADFVAGFERGAGSATREREARRSDVDTQPARVRLRSIAVQGLRGIGKRAELHLSPVNGLTIVCGRNGSGKSSFAEGLDLALRQRTSRAVGANPELWSAWRNVHHPGGALVRVGLAVEGEPPLEIGVDWPDGEAAWTEHSVFTQFKSAKREPGLERLGWADALSSTPPLLSYEELGSMFDRRPSERFDAIYPALGLAGYEDARARLASRLKLCKPTRNVTQAKAAALQVLDGIDGPRAALATALLRRHKGAGADEIQTLLAGACLPDDTLTRLHQLAGLHAPGLEEVLAALHGFTGATDELARMQRQHLSAADDAVDMLARALAHRARHGTVTCPVCGIGSLDDDWQHHAEAAVADAKDTRHLLAEGRSAASAAEEVWRGVHAGPPTVLQPVADDIDEVADAATAWGAWSGCTSTDERQVTELLTATSAAVQALNRAAEVEYARRQDAWAAAVEPLQAWLSAVREEQRLAPLADVLTQAKNWLDAFIERLRVDRLMPLATEAKHIWAQLKQQSSVDLGTIEVQGTNTRRALVIPGEVDGVEQGALSVMSQGELHALALALFIPRCNLGSSPFGFVVLDDPIQAMDPGKVEGFVEVLFDLARSKQVVVFSHDDRLPAAVRRHSGDARVLEIVRDAGSVVTVRDASDPVKRYLDDAWAVAQQVDISDDLKRQVLPGILRGAVECQAREAYVRHALEAGQHWRQIDDALAAAPRTRQLVALAVGIGESEVSGWADAKPQRRRGLRAVGRSAHQGLEGDIDQAVQDVRWLVRDLGAVL